MTASEQRGSCEEVKSFWKHFGGVDNVNLTVVSGSVQKAFFHEIDLYY